MSKRRWGVQTKGKFNSSEFITLNKLQHTVRALKLKGESYVNNCWASPIIPLLIEHVFISIIKDLKQIDSITIDLAEGRDLKL